MKHITLVHGDDWIGVYVDGVIQYQSHSIDSSELLELAGVEYESREADPTWLNGYVESELPETLSEVEFYPEDDWFFGDKMIRDGRAKYPDKDGKVPPGTEFIVQDDWIRNGRKGPAQLYPAIDTDFL